MAALPGLFLSGIVALLPVLAVGCDSPVTAEPIGHLHLRAVLDVRDPAAAAAEHQTFDGEVLALGPDRVFPVAEAEIVVMAKTTSFPVPAPKGEIAIRCQIAADRSQEFEAWTAELVGRRLAWLVDGRVIIAPVVKSALPGGIILWGGRDEWSREDTEHFLECVLEAIHQT